MGKVTQPCCSSKDGSEPTKKDAAEEKPAQDAPAEVAEAPAEAEWREWNKQIKNVLILKWETVLICFKILNILALDIKETQEEFKGT